MKIINQSHEILTDVLQMTEIPEMIELAGRTCYKSEYKITSTSSDKFCMMLIKRGHEAMIEHGNISVRFITDRGVTHELVRHRIGTAFAQESTRYVNYENDDMQFVKPTFPWASENPQFNGKMILWRESMRKSEEAYKDMMTIGCSPQEARSVLPNSLKTEIVVTANIREWRHIFKLRTAKAAHPQIRELMIPLLEEFIDIVPALFQDIEVPND